MNAKQLTDRNGKPVTKGTVVHHGEGHARVASVYVGSQTVNLCGIFSSRITDKRVPLADIYEDHEAWYAHWQQSETYQSM
jgi:hypothetical protein